MNLVAVMHADGNDIGFRYLNTQFESVGPGGLPIVEERKGGIVATLLWLWWLVHHARYF